MRYTGVAGQSPKRILRPLRLEHTCAEKVPVMIRESASRDRFLYCTVVFLEFRRGILMSLASRIRFCDNHLPMNLLGHKRCVMCCFLLSLWRTGCGKQIRRDNPAWEQDSGTARIVRPCSAHRSFINWLACSLKRGCTPLNWITHFCPPCGAHIRAHAWPLPSGATEEMLRPGWGVFRLFVCALGGSFLTLLLRLLTLKRGTQSPFENITDHRQQCQAPSFWHAMSFAICATFWFDWWRGFGTKHSLSLKPSMSTWRWKLGTWYFRSLPSLLQGIDLIGGCIHAEHIQAQRANLVPCGLLWYDSSAATPQICENHVVIRGRVSALPNFINICFFAHKGYLFTIWRRGVANQLACPSNLDGGQTVVLVGMVGKIAG